MHTTRGFIGIVCFLSNHDDKNSHQLSISAQLAVLLGRTVKSIGTQATYINHPECYKKESNNVREVVDPVWWKRVVIALSKLTGQEGSRRGLLKMIQETWHDMDSEKANVFNLPKWHKAAMWVLFKTPLVAKILISNGKVDIITSSRLCEGPSENKVVADFWSVRTTRALKGIVSSCMYLQVQK